jgi:hypothetical protein
MQGTLQSGRPLFLGFLWSGAGVDREIRRSLGRLSGLDGLFLEVALLLAGLDCVGHSNDEEDEKDFSDKEPFNLVGDAQENGANADNDGDGEKNQLELEVAQDRGADEGGEKVNGKAGEKDLGPLFVIVPRTVLVVMKRLDDVVVFDDVDPRFGVAFKMDLGETDCFLTRLADGQGGGFVDETALGAFFVDPALNRDMAGYGVVD